MLETHQLARLSVVRPATVICMQVAFCLSGCPPLPAGVEILSWCTQSGSSAKHVVYLAQNMEQRLQNEVYTPIEMWHKEYRHLKVPPSPPGVHAVAALASPESTPKVCKPSTSA